MKRVFTDRLVATCDLVKAQLESSGIRTELKNERGSATVGEGLPVFSEPTLPFAWPEVWVSDEDEQAALAIIADVGTNLTPEELEREAMNPDNKPDEPGPAASRL